MKAVLLFLIMSIFASCGSIPYEKRTGSTSGPAFDTGFYDYLIKGNTYNVGFLGNGRNDPYEVRQFFRKRSLEVAKQKGFKGFCILKEGPANVGWPGKAIWYGHAGDVELTNNVSGKDCFSE